MLLEEVVLIEEVVNGETAVDSQVGTQLDE